MAQDAQKGSHKSKPAKPLVRPAAVQTNASNPPSPWQTLVERAQSDPRLLTPGNLQHLQRSVGNRATSQLLQKEPARAKVNNHRVLAPSSLLQRIEAEMVQRVALSEDDYAALVEQVHNAIAGIGTDEEAIYVALQKLKKDPTAVSKMKQAYKDKYKTELEADLRGDLSDTELAFALELINVKDDAKAGDVVGSVPGTAEEYKSAASKLLGAMKGIGTDEEAIYGALMPFDRDKTKLDKLKQAYQDELSGGLTGKGLEADLKDEMSGEELAYALYLLNAPPPGSVGAHTQATVNDAGTEGASEKVEGGSVSARHGVKYSPPGGGSVRPEGFTMEYKGGLASESRWLQFIWREIVVSHPTKGEYRVRDTVTTTGGTYDLTTDPSKPSYNTDSNKPDSPFYEAGFRSNRTADSTTIFDQPGAITDKVSAEFDKGATKVVSRAHFNSYLVRDYRPIYHVYLKVEWAFNSKATPPRTQSVESSGKVTALPEGMKKRLVAQYPAFDYIL